MRITRLFSLIILVTVLLAACSAGIETGSPELATPAATAAPVNTQTPAKPTIPPNAVKMECQVVSLVPTPGPTEVSMFPPVQEDDWVSGNPDAAMTIIEYSDFQCPYCSLLAKDLKELVEQHPDDVQVIFRHFPLPSHPLSKAGAYASEAAGLQGKFWEMHDIIFASQETTNTMPLEQFEDWLVEQAAGLGLDQDQFVEDMNSQEIIDKVEQAQQHGLNIGIPGTPLVIVNGQPYQGPRDVGSFEALMGLFSLADRQYTACPPMVIDPQKEYTATLKTDKGDAVIQLFADKAPLAVNSFVFLAREGWFNGVTFHRVLPGFVAQAGDPSGSGMGGPGYFFSSETSDLKYDKAGVIGMANSGADSNGSQFFITYKALPELDGGGYTIFGEVIEGMDVLEQLSARDPSQQMGLPPGDKILSVEISEK